MPARTNDSGEDGFFSVVAITCFPPKDFKETIRVNFLQRSSAYAWCDKLQDQIDADGQPARSYVFDKDNVPIRAGRSAHAASDYFFSKYETRVRRRA